MVKSLMVRTVHDMLFGRDMLRVRSCVVRFNNGHYATLVQTDPKVDLFSVQPYIINEKGYLVQPRNLLPEGGDMTMTEVAEFLDRCAARPVTSWAHIALKGSAEPLEALEALIWMGQQHLQCPLRTSSASAPGVGGPALKVGPI